MTNLNGYTAKSHVASLIIWTRLFKFSGLAPHYSEFENKFILNNARKCWNVAIVLIILIAFAVVFPERVLMLRLAWTGWLILDPFSTFSILAVNILTTASTSYFNRDAFLSIFNELLWVDVEFKALGAKVMNSKRALFRKLGITNLCLFYITSWVLYFYYTVAQTRHQKYGFLLLECAQKWHMFNMIILMEHLQLSVKTQFKNVNEILGIYSEGLPISAIEINRLRNVYIILLKQIQDFNDVFGQLILIYFVYTVTSYIAITSSITINNMGPKVMGAGYFGASIVNSSHILWMISIIAITCGGTTKAARETGPLCYILCSKLRRSHNVALYDELITFARVASMSNPVISAAGFFTVDYAMLSNVFTILISYIIVILQLYR